MTRLGKNHTRFFKTETRSIWNATDCHQTVRTLDHRTIGQGDLYSVSGVDYFVSTSLAIDVDAVAAKDVLD